MITFASMPALALRAARLHRRVRQSRRRDAATTVTPEVKSNAQYRRFIYLGFSGGNTVVVVPWGRFESETACAALSMAWSMMLRQRSFRDPRPSLRIER